MKEPQRETPALDVIYSQELRAGGMRKALKNTWQQARIPGKITLQEATVYHDKLRFHRCSVALTPKGKSLEMQASAAYDKLEDSQKAFVHELGEYLATGPFTTLLHNMRGMHVFWIQNKIHIVLQLLKATTNTHTNLKTFEKWVKFKHPEVESTFTLVNNHNHLFRFGNEKLSGKLPFRSVFGKETVLVDFENQGRLVYHLQADNCESLSVQHDSNQKFLEWMRPVADEQILFWQSRSPLWIQLALNAGTKVQLFSNHYATIANLKILGRKLTSLLRIQDRDTPVNQLLEWVKKYPFQSMVIEDNNKIMSRKWFEAIENTECRKILRVYEDLNILSEESRVFHKYNWSLLKATALQTQANEKHFKIIVLYTTGRIKDIGSRQAPAPSKSGPKFVQK